MADTDTKELTGFPSLKPAVITKVNIGDIHQLGESVPRLSSTFSLNANQLPQAPFTPARNSRIS